LWRDDAGAVRGVARLIPTTFPYMIRDLWPDLVEDGTLPCHPGVWELSRMGVDHDLPADQRRRAADELMCACAEFGLQNGISAFLMVTHIHLIRASIAAGWNSAALGQPRRLGRFPVVAARTEISEETLAAARRSYGIAQPVLRVIGDELAMAA
jgi:acyl homoserine lactone synthase